MTKTRNPSNLHVLAVSIGLVASLSLSSIGCDLIDDESGLPPPSFVAAPDTVASGEAFQLVFTLRNPTSRTVTFTTPHSCVYTPQLILDEEVAYLGESDVVCLTVVTTHKIPPGDSIHLIDDVVAADESSDGPLPPGTYEVRAVMERLAGAKPVVPDVETHVTVVE